MTTNGVDLMWDYLFFVSLIFCFFNNNNNILTLIQKQNYSKNIDSHLLAFTLQISLWSCYFTWFHTSEK